VLEMARHTSAGSLGSVGENPRGVPGVKKMPAHASFSWNTEVVDLSDNEARLERAIEPLSSR
jgi:hypothetical protein